MPTVAELREQLADAALEWWRWHRRFLDTPLNSPEQAKTGGAMDAAWDTMRELAAQIEALPHPPTEAEAQDIGRSTL